MAQAAQACPMDVPGAQARAQDVPEGVALVIVTSQEDQVADLQQRSRRMLEQQGATGMGGGGMNQYPGGDMGQQPGMGGGGMGQYPGGDMGQQPGMGGETGQRHGKRQGKAEQPGMGGGGMAGGPSVPASASVQDTPEGVIILYTAMDPAQQEQLSSDIHRSAQLMDAGQCPEMGAGMSPSGR